MNTIIMMVDILFIDSKKSSAVSYSELTRIVASLP